MKKFINFGNINEMCEWLDENVKRQGEYNELLKENVLAVDGKRWMVSDNDNEYNGIEVFGCTEHVICIAKDEKENLCALICFVDLYHDEVNFEVVALDFFNYANAVAQYADYIKTGGEDGVFEVFLSFGDWLVDDGSDAILIYNILEYGKDYDIDFVGVL